MLNHHNIKRHAMSDHQSIGSDASKQSAPAKPKYKFPDKRSTCPYSKSATATERYSILTGDPNEKMFLFSNHYEPGRLILTYPTRSELTATIDKFISEGKRIRFSSVPMTKSGRSVTVLFGDTFEWWQKEDAETIADGFIGRFPLGWKMRILRRTLGHYVHLYILSIG